MADTKLWLVGALFACGGGAIVEACGIDEGGLAPIDAALDVAMPDAGPGDVQAFDVVTDVVLPPTCATTDLSCFGLGDGGLPEGWSPYLYVPDGGACPSTAYAPQSLVTNTQLAGGCVCTCSGEGSWSCPATLDVTGGTGPQCNPGFVTIPTGVCQDVAAFNLDHIEQTQGAIATGNGVACEAGAPTPPVVTSNGVTLCGASCDAGAAAVCGTPSGHACIAHSDVQPCPANLTRILVGGSADPSCNGCSCTAQTAAPACTAVAHLYWSTGGATDPNCSDSGTTQDVTLNSTCQGAHAYDSYFATWNDPGPVTCTPGGGGGDAGLSAPTTLCCAN